MAEETTAADTGVAESGLYDLDSVDPEIREHLAPHLKAIEANATKKFQEAAEYRKGWAPYEELGLKDVPPETVGELLGFLQVASDPTQFAEWWKAAGEERGLFEGGDDTGLEGIEDLSTDKIQEMIAEQIAKGLNPIQETLQAQEQSRLEQQANQEIEDQLKQIRADNPQLPEGAENAIVRLAYSYADEDGSSAIEKGFEEYKALISQGEKGLFEQKANQPGVPEGAGAPSTTTEPITSFGDPRLKASAAERLRKSLTT